MGHIRLGILPRTRKWIEVLDLIGGGAGSSEVAAAKGRVHIRCEIFAVTAVAAARELVAEAAAAMVVRRRGERTGKEKQEGILVSTQPQ